MAGQVKQFLKDGWLTIILMIVTAIFTSGATYSSMRGEIKVNAADIQEVKTDINNRLDKIDHRFDILEEKIDSIDRYLREHK